MHWIDLLIVGIVAWFTFRAFANGLIWEVSSLLSVVLGVVLAGLIYSDLAESLEFLIENDTWRNLISFIAVFAGIVVLGQLAAIALRRVAALLLLGPLDHLGGAAFGFAKALLLIQVALILVAVYPPSGAVGAAVDDSAIAPLFLDSVPVAEVALPNEFEDALTQLQDWRQRIDREPTDSGDTDSGDGDTEGG
jgi:membrane protein required for colicin V production